MKCKCGPEDCGSRWTLSAGERSNARRQVYPSYVSKGKIASVEKPRVQFYVQDFIGAPISRGSRSPVSCHVEAWNERARPGLIPPLCAFFGVPFLPRVIWNMLAFSLPVRVLIPLRATPYERGGKAIWKRYDGEKRKVARAVSTRSIVGLGYLYALFPSFIALRALQSSVTFGLPSVNISKRGLRRPLFGDGPFW